MFFWQAKSDIIPEGVCNTYLMPKVKFSLSQSNHCCYVDYECADTEQNPSKIQWNWQCYVDQKIEQNCITNGIAATTQSKMWKMRKFYLIIHKAINVLFWFHNQHSVELQLGKIFVCVEKCKCSIFIWISSANWTESNPLVINYGVFYSIRNKKKEKRIVKFQRKGNQEQPKCAWVCVSCVSWRINNDAYKHRFAAAKMSNIKIYYG